MNLKELEDFTKSVKPQLEEILKLLKQNADEIEAAAAKIINEIKSVIHDCPCNKEILDVLKTGTSNKEIILADDKFRKPLRYSYPNIGNEEIGTEKGKEKLSWPFGIIKKPT